MFCSHVICTCRTCIESCCHLTQVSIDVDLSLLQLGCQPSSLPVITHIADALSHMFLPSVTPVTRQAPHHHRRRLACSFDIFVVIYCPTFEIASEPVSHNLQKTAMTSTTLPRVDTGLKGKRSGPSPPSYIARTNNALRSVAEEHLRRQLSLERYEQEKVISASVFGLWVYTHP